MRSLLFAFWALCLLAVPGLGQTVDDGSPLIILPEMSTACGSPADSRGFSTIKDFSGSEATWASSAYCEADCLSGTVSCEGLDCEAHDSICGQRVGWVQCDDDPIYCNDPTVECCGGDRFTPAGCCMNGRHRTLWEKCVDNQWELYTYQCGQLGCGPVP